MIEQEKISEFIDWAIANIQAIAGINGVPHDDVWDVVDDLKKLILMSCTVELEKSYYRESEEEGKELESLHLIGWIPVDNVSSEEEAVKVVNRWIAEGLQTIDDRITWDQEVEDGWIYEDFTFGTTGETDD